MKNKLLEFVYLALNVAHTIANNGPALLVAFVLVGAGLTGVMGASVLVSTLAADRAIDRIQTPPSSTTMYTYLTRALTRTEIERRTDSANATPESAFTTDLPSAQRTDAYVQQFVIRNTSTDLGGASAILCFGEVAWSGVTTCTALCAASALTCSGASTDGRHIAAAQEFATREDGTVCGCVVGAAGGTAYQTTRSTR